jgi:hypothetical protein
MITPRTVRYSCLAALVVLAAACAGPRDPETPAEKSARGDELLRKMSDSLKAAPALSFKVVESHERLRRSGEKQPYTLNRKIVVRRPDRLSLHTTGSDGRDVRVAYDGKTVTVLGDAQKVYASIKTPATLDETLDYISERFDLRVGVADFLYSSPYDSFDIAAAQGGWVRRTTVGGKSCEEVSYTAKTVDVTLSMTGTAPVLPCEAQIVYKQEPGQPVSRFAFSDWNLDPRPADAQFALNVPQGYELIPIIERIPKSELKADPAKAMGAPAK